jgi:hypothetical protein
LLPTISFPAFSTHEEVLYNETKANIIRRLKGNYGFKRFSRDGYKTILEDPGKRYYKADEIQVNLLIFNSHNLAFIIKSSEYIYQFIGIRQYRVRMAHILYFYDNRWSV